MPQTAFYVLLAFPEVLRQFDKFLHRLWPDGATDRQYFSRSFRLEDGRQCPISLCKPKGAIDFEAAEQDGSVTITQIAAWTNPDGTNSCEDKALSVRVDEIGLSRTMVTVSCVHPILGPFCNQIVMLFRGYYGTLIEDEKLDTPTVANPTEKVRRTFESAESMKPEHSTLAQAKAAEVQAGVPLADINDELKEFFGAGQGEVVTIDAKERAPVGSRRRRGSDVGNLGMAEVIRLIDQDREKNGCTVKTACERHGIASKTYYNHKKK